MFVSFGTKGTGNPAIDQDPDLIDGADAMGRDGYRARHAQPDDHLVDDILPEEPLDEPEEIAPAGGTAVAGVSGDWAVDEWAVDGWDGPEDFRFAVRPYTWTQGRTRPVQDLAVETLVFTSDQGREMTSICSTEHAAIAQLCAEVRSVAEVAALLALPLGVARVLLADMIDTGLMNVHRNPLSLGNVPDLSLMERVLAGLQRL